VEIASHIHAQPTAQICSIKVCSSLNARGSRNRGSPMHVMWTTVVVWAE
jgi:hypothetical protein